MAWSDRRHAIIRTNAGGLLIEPLEKNQWDSNENSKLLIQENVFENVVCEMVPICFGVNVLNAHKNFLVCS